MIYNSDFNQTIGSSNAPLMINTVTDKSFTEGYFSDDFSIIAKTASRMNLSEEDAFKLIEKIRSELPMSQ